MPITSICATRLRYAPLIRSHLLRGNELLEDRDDILYEDAAMEEEAAPQTTTTGPVAFVAYQDGSVRLFALPDFSEIGCYTQLYVGNTLLQPSDVKPRGRGVFVREMLVTRVGVSAEPAMTEWVFVVGEAGRCDVVRALERRAAALPPAGGQPPLLEQVRHGSEGDGRLAARAARRRKHGESALGVRGGLASSHDHRAARTRPAAASGAAAESS